MAEKQVISVNLEKLKTAEQRMATLNQALSARKLNNPMQKAKGDTAEQVELAMTRLNELGEALAQLTNKTYLALQATRIAFEEADEKASAIWQYTTNDGGE